MGKRAESRERIEAQIVDIGRRHLVIQGAAGLSLRAVARDLGMVSSAVYRYVASRDDLLTLLVTDAYTELATVVERARPAAGSWREDILAIVGAARTWAVANPAAWALLYGSPVPGYHAPRTTVEPGTRVVAALFDAVGAGIAAGDIPDADDAVAQPLSSDYDGIRAEFGFAGGDVAVTRSIVLWATVVGAISLEVFGQYGADTFRDPAAAFDVALESVVDGLTHK